MKEVCGKWMLTKREAENIVRPETQAAAIKTLSETYRDADIVEAIVKEAETMCADAIAVEWIKVPTTTYDGHELFYKA
jgi:hypothetical protein